MTLCLNNAGRFQSSLCSNPPTSSRWYLSWFYRGNLIIKKVLTRCGLRPSLINLEFDYVKNG
ncbi:MAG: hypothetical protein ACI85O_002516 [Saprospiraceae bacterium]|jgi:hypothetical protein